MASKGSVEVEFLEDKRISDEEGGQADKESEGEEVSENAGWADAMARILHKELPPDKDPVLAKYKKGNKEKTERQEESRKRKSKAQERHLLLEKDHIIPDIARTDHERNFIKIATRGVVQLFNAVNKHQKEVESKLKAAPTEAKKAKVVESLSKTAFLDMLKSSSDKGRHTVQQGTEKQPKIREERVEKDSGSSWSILRDDFMMGAKMKDWDREGENNNNEGDNEDISTDSSEDFDESDQG